MSFFGLKTSSKGKIVVLLLLSWDFPFSYLFVFFSFNFRMVTQLVTKIDLIKLIKVTANKFPFNVTVGWIGDIFRISSFDEMRLIEENLCWTQGISHGTEFVNKNIQIKSQLLALSQFNAIVSIISHKKLHNFPQQKKKKTFPNSHS